MISTIIWGLFALTYACIASKSLVNNYETAKLIIYAAGFIGLTSTFISKLYCNSFTFYLYWNRFKYKLRNYTTKWKITIRYDGTFPPEVIKVIEQYILAKKENGKILHANNNSINFTINDALNFYLDYQPKHINKCSFDTLDVSLTTFEIGCNDSKAKLDTEIIPILTELNTLIKPDNVSYALSISFIDNPFFALLLSHLKDEYIKSFSLDLKLNKYNVGENADKVSINKSNIVINSNDLHSLNELAKDFIYLSNNLKHYVKGTKNA
ncbi:MAG: hypothetical protein Q7U71_07765 [bacterium]|nr:hypothetical protein [bacterium]